MKKYVDNLIEEELKVTVKKDTSNLPETIELFEVRLIKLFHLIYTLV